MDHSKRDKIIKYGSNLVSVALLVLIILFLKRNSEVLLSLRHLRVSDILIIALLQPILVAITALINKMIIDEMGVVISFRVNFFLQYVNTLLNKLIAEGGAVYRGAYLKTQFSFPVSDFFASIGGAYLITLLVNSAFGLLFLLIIDLISNITNYYIVLFFSVTLIIMLLFIIFTPNIKGKGWLVENINRVMQGWARIKGKPGLLVKIILLNILIMFLQSVTIFIAYRGLDANIGFMNSVFYSSLSSLANFINITPGGLGITEGFLMFSYEAIGIPIDMILLGALLIRAINLIVSVLLGVISYLFLQIKIQNNVSY